MKQVDSALPSNHSFQGETMRTYENPFQELELLEEQMPALSRVLSGIVVKVPKIHWSLSSQK